MQVWLTPPEWERLVSDADAADLSYSDVLRQAWLRQREGECTPTKAVG